MVPWHSLDHGDALHLLQTQRDPQSFIEVSAKQGVNLEGNVATQNMLVKSAEAEEILLAKLSPCLVRFLTTAESALKVQKVFGIAELADQILLDVSVYDLLAIQQVN